MNIKKLIANLGKFPETAEVLTTWEGTFHELDEDQLYLAPNGAVILDANANFYKDEILTGERVPEP